MSKPAPHPDAAMLLRVVDEDVSTLEEQEIGAHLADCGDCRDRADALREALASYERFHRAILKPSLAPPPRPWRPLPFPKRRRAVLRPMPWLAAAAAVAAVLTVVRMFEQAPAVRAAELLRKATAAERTTPLARARIRIRTYARTVDREARLAPGPESAGAAEIRRMFDAAGYRWDDPLSAQAFSRWREGLREKQDRIEEVAGVYLVRTSPRDGPLADAALSLRAADLHAFACTLRFRAGGEAIEMTELPAETPTPHATMPVPAQAMAPLPPSPSARAVTAGDEVRVMAALHGIGADLGEPIEVQREGDRIVVRMSSLEERRRNQIAAALAGMPFVQLRPEEVGRGEARAPLASGRMAAPADRINPLIAELAQRLGDKVPLTDLTDELIDATDRAAERAFALRALARRFPVDVAALLPAEESGLLRKMERDHLAGLAAALQEIRRLAAPILPASPPPAGASAENWQALAEGLPGTVDRLDRTLNGATDAGDARKAQLAQLLVDLDRQAAALQLMVRA